MKAKKLSKIIQAIMRQDTDEHTKLVAIDMFIGNNGDGSFVYGCCGADDRRAFDVIERAVRS